MFSPELAKSVLAVPPLARTKDGQFNDQANAAIIQHLEGGGVSSLVYGGNAMAQHWPISLYGEWLDRLSHLAAETSWIIPSVGPDAGKLVDQARLLRSRDFPVALLLPMGPPRTEPGTLSALRTFHDASGVRVLVYIKTDGYISAAALGQLFREGVVYGVKYAVPRADPARDSYLDDIISAVGADRVVSGFGEPPAVPHMLTQKLAGFTAGCVCLAPALSMALLRALQAGDAALAKARLAPFLPLEALRTEINEIRVLHEAIALCGLAETGPILLPSHGVNAEDRPRIEAAARALLEAERAFVTQRAA